MQSSEALFEPLAKRSDAFAVNTSSPVIGPDALPGNLQVLPLVPLSINEWTFLAPVGLIQSASLLGR